MKIGPQLLLERCPRCARHRPTLIMAGQPIATAAFDQSNPRTFVVYVCASCGGAILAFAKRPPQGQLGEVEEILPNPTQLSDTIPEAARRFLSQAQESLHVPDGAVMLAASAVDSLLKAKDYRDGTLHARIKKAVDDHLLTPDMGLWAHQVRLEANKPRHADEQDPHASELDAKRSLEFVLALANIMFELPALVTRGLKEAGGTPVAEGGAPPEP
jgi:hypothetical protein